MIKILKMPKTKYCETKKESPKLALSLFWVDHLLLGMRPPKKCGLLTQWDLLEKLIFSSVSSFQSEINICWLGMGDHVHFCLRAHTPPSMDLCRPCTCCQSLWGHMSISPISLASFIPSDSYNLSIFSFTEMPESRGEGCGGDNPFRTEYPKASTLCPFSRYCFLYWFSSTAGRSFSDIE